MKEGRKKTLQKLCLVFRSKLIDLLYSVQTSHPGGSLPYTEILAAPYYELMDVDPMNPEKEDRGHLISSKGHGAPILYPVLAHKGFFPLAGLKDLRQTGSMLQGHPYVYKTPGMESSTGPLGLGLSAGLGMVLGSRLKGYDSYTYVIMGDEEIQEGCVWGVALSTSKFKADHLIGILDNNGVQLNGTLEDIMPMGDMKAKWEAFGWNVILCDGHDVEGIYRTVEEAKVTADKPSLILTKTVKGKGVSSMGSKNIWRGKAIGDQEYVQAKAELGGDR